MRELIVIIQLLQFNMFIKRVEIEQYVEFILVHNKIELKTEELCEKYQMSFGLRL